MWRLLLLSFIWGWSFLFIKVAGEGMTPMTVAWLRLVLGALALVVIARATGLALPTGRARWRTLAVAAVLGNAVPFTLLAWSTQHIPSGLTAVLNASTPLFTAIAAAAYLHERLRAPQVLGLVFGFVGVALAAGFGAADLTDSSWLGALAAVGAGACYGAAFVYMRRHLVDIPPLAAATGQLLLGAAIMAPLGIATSVADRFDPTPTRVLAVVLLGVFGTGIAYILNYRLLADIGATKTSLTTYIVPVVAVVLGVVVLGETFSLRILAGGGLIALGIALVNERVFGRGRRPPVPATAAVVLALLLVLGVGGCGGDDDATGTGGEACQPERTEALDPNSGQLRPARPAERARAVLPLRSPDLRAPPAGRAAIRLDRRTAAEAGPGRPAGGGTGPGPVRRRARPGDDRRRRRPPAGGPHRPQPRPGIARGGYGLASQARVFGDRPGGPARLRRELRRAGSGQPLIDRPIGRSTRGRG
jgi:drug/metabolite transporter (DMT)-like permease